MLKVLPVCRQRFAGIRLCKIIAPIFVIVIPLSVLVRDVGGELIIAGKFRVHPVVHEFLGIFIAFDVCRNVQLFGYFSKGQGVCAIVAERIHPKCNICR